MSGNALKLFTSAQIREWDKFTIEHDGISSADLMERAATACTESLLQLYPLQKEFAVVAGSGNNGGDGLAIARLLAGKNKNVNVYIIRSDNKAGSDFVINEERLRALNNSVNIFDLQNADQIPEFKDSDCLIDAIFGTGLNKEIGGIAAVCIQKINQSGAQVIAIDIPSGMFADRVSTDSPVIVRANHTLSFQVPKLAFMFPESEAFTGQWHLLDIGLSDAWYRNNPTDKYLLDSAYISSLLMPRKKFAHKGQFGHALLFAGSYGKMGAAVLAARSALRSGLGLLSVHVPRCGVEVLQSSVPEAMIQADEHEFVFSSPGEVSDFNAIGVGPGIGCGEETDYGMEELLRLSEGKAMVLDADAINLLASDSELLTLLTPKSILTPHVGEFDRLCGKSSNGSERNEKQLEFSKKHQVYTLLKGAHSCVCTPEGISYFNNSGNPGMAKGGSGDVLTGLITGLLAQMPQSPLEAALIAVYVHGLAGDIAASEYGETGMKAGDIADSLPEAFKRIAE